MTNGRRPIEKLEDFSGLKLRVVQSPLFIDLFTQLGTNPVPIPFPELYTALEQQVVDGQENPLVTIESMKFNEVQKYLSITRHIYNPQAVLISKRTWDNLSGQERTIVSEAAVESRDYQRKVSREKNAQSVENLRKTGMQVNEVPISEMDRIREKIKPVVTKYSEHAGKELLDEINAEIAKRRQSR
jgi:tripartite ATP-independent transporter DctP family solute receptor